LKKVINKNYGIDGELRAFSIGVLTPADHACPP
jgi:hypothetical protein